MRLLKMSAWCLLVVLVSSTRPATQTPAKGQPMLFEGARLIAGDGSAPIEQSAILVENGRISRVGRRGEVKPPSGATRVDLTGKTVMPAIIDAHNHIGYQNYKELIWGCGDRPPLCRAQNFTRENILDHMQRGAYNGVGAIWSAGYDFGDMPYQLRDEILAGKHPNAARFLPSGPGLTTPDTVRVDLGRQNDYGVSTVREVQIAIEELASRRVKVIKMWVQGGGGIVGGGKGSLKAMEPDLYTAAITEAHKRGMKVFVHAHESVQAPGLIRAGIDGFAHQVGDSDDPPVISPEALAALKQAGPKLFMALTMAGPPGGGHPAAFRNAPALLRETAHPLVLRRLIDTTLNAMPPTPEAIERANRVWDATKTRIRQYMEAGLRIGMGSDAGGVNMGTNIIGWSAHIEMEEMVAAGMTPMQVITAATKTNAEFFELDDMGTIAPGKSADFIVLDANPLDDIRSTRQISRVYLRGNEVDRAGLRRTWSGWWSGLTSSN